MSILLGMFLMTFLTKGWTFLCCYWEKKGLDFLEKREIEKRDMIRNVRSSENEFNNKRERDLVREKEEY